MNTYAKRLYSCVLVCKNIHRSTVIGKSRFTSMILTISLSLYSKLSKGNVNTSIHAYTSCCSAQKETGNNSR